MGLLIKIIGSVLILTGGTAAGFLLSGSCRDRIRQLREIQGFINVLENEIYYMNHILLKALKNTASSGRGVSASLFMDCAKFIEDRSGTASEAWHKAVDHNKARMALSEEDWIALRDFGNLLGKSNTEGQIANIKAIREKLKTQEKNAMEYSEKNQKMYRSLGFLGGLTLIIILI